MSEERDELGKIIDEDDSVSIQELLLEEGMKRAHARYGKLNKVDPTEYQYFAEGYKDGAIAMLNKGE